MDIVGIEIHWILRAVVFSFFILAVAVFIRSKCKEEGTNYSHRVIEEESEEADVGPSDLCDTTRNWDEVETVPSMQELLREVYSCQQPAEQDEGLLFGKNAEMRNRMRRRLKQQQEKEKKQEPVKAEELEDPLADREALEGLLRELEAPKRPKRALKVYRRRRLQPAVEVQHSHSGTDSIVHNVTRSAEAQEAHGVAETCNEGLDAQPSQSRDIGEHEPHAESPQASSEPHCQLPASDDTTPPGGSSSLVGTLRPSPTKGRPVKKNRKCKTGQTGSEPSTLSDMQYVVSNVCAHAASEENSESVYVDNKACTTQPAAVKPVDEEMLRRIALESEADVLKTYLNLLQKRLQQVEEELAAVPC